MKTAIYIEQGITQLVLTPDNEWEKKIVESISTGSQAVEIKRGSFYQCRGNWVRFDERQEDESLILVVGIKPDATENP